MRFALFDHLQDGMPLNVVAEPPNQSELPKGEH